MSGICGFVGPGDPATVRAMLETIDYRGDTDHVAEAEWWDGDHRRLTLVRDPFGNRSLYVCEHAGVFYFASEVKQILAIPGLPVAIDPAAMETAV